MDAAQDHSSCYSLGVLSSRYIDDDDFGDLSMAFCW